MNIGDIKTNKKTGQKVRVTALNDDGSFDYEPVQAEPTLDTSMELTGADRARFTQRASGVQGELDAIKGLGKQGVIENGKAYIIEGGKKYEPDSPETTLSDVTDVLRYGPEGIGAAGGAVLGALASVPSFGADAPITVPLMTGGGAAGGLAVQHKLGQTLGVIPENKPLPLGEMATTGVANAVLPVLGEKVMASPAGQAVKQAGSKALGALGDVAKGAITYPLAGASGVKAESIARMATKEGEMARPMTKNIQEAMRKTSEELGSTITKAKNKLHLEYKNGLRALGIESAPIDVSQRLAPALDLIEGEYRVLSKGAKSKIGNESDVKAIQDYLTEALSPGQTMDDAEDLISRIDADIAWPSPMQAPRIVSDKAQNALRAVRSAVRESMSDAAAASGKGTEFETLKETAQKNIGMFEQLRGFLGGKADKSLRNIESDANWKASEALDALAGLVPEAAPVIDKARATTLAYDFAGGGPKHFLGADRPMGFALGSGLAGGASAALGGDITKAIPAAIAYGATRPPVVRDMAYLAGKGARAAAPAISALGPLADVAATQTAVQAVGKPALGALVQDANGSELPALGTSKPKQTQVDPGAVIQSIQSQIPGLTQFVKTNYGANYARAKQAGIPDDQATLQILSSVANKSKFGAGFGGLLKNLSVIATKSAGAPVSPSDIQWALQEYQ